MTLLDAGSIVRGIPVNNPARPSPTPSNKQIIVRLSETPFFYANLFKHDDKKARSLVS